MKKILALCTVLGVLAVPATMTSAAPEGLYVAPKIIYGLTQINSPELTNFGTTSNAAYKPYFGLGDKTDSTFGGSIAVGYDFSKQFNVPIRAEVEYSSFSDAEAQGSEARVFISPGNAHITGRQTFGIQTLFLNVYYDFETGTRYTPYIGAGLGQGFIDISGHLVFSANGLMGSDIITMNIVGANSEKITNFAWNIGAGVGISLTEKWTLDAGYRFVDLGSIEVISTGLPGFRVNNDGNVYHFYGQFPVDMKTKNLYQHQFSLGARYTF